MNELIENNENLACRTLGIERYTTQPQASSTNGLINPKTRQCNPVTGRTAQQIEQLYSTGSQGHFHCNFSCAEGVQPSAVEIGRKTGDISQPQLEKQEIAGGESLV